ncbi:metalloregulator ArsR/SmtB family transcription factor [Rhizorhapis sp. SPR117]|uniref:metalloregulator ArsR/SmtB family transcription factor n=1 Tax=Rhizorhapis sp. SPR117 TaxID=2912611 RepID=UPI001F00B6C4|nr:metalloregulator ArsR/SmtB family transcription factor [Rhizorhapis sp. SPR117]
MASILDIFRALADPTRLRIIYLLRSMELAIGEIAQVVGQSQPRVSRHVRILVEAGLAERRKEGSWVFLRLDQAVSIAALMRFMDETALSDSETLWVKADLARLAAVRNDRAQAAERYFAEHAEEWDAIRSLHVPEAEVEAVMQDMLDGHAIGRLLDIGTGTGRMLQLFGASAVHAVAVDRSPEMLRFARAKLPETGSDKYELLLGDFYALPLENGVSDTVIVHQVLHYAQQPELVIEEAARVLGPQGRLLIVDFAAHEREELRSRDAHARLGFSDDQIGRWFDHAGFETEVVRTLEGSELTVKLWLGRRREAQVLPIKGRNAS